MSGALAKYASSYNLISKLKPRIEIRGDIKFKT